jgi:formamidopyrimidine-DNA glycosylase
MPELPEVETIARALKEGGRGGQPIIGLTVKGVQLLWLRTLASANEDQFAARLVGQQVLDVGRRGKFLMIRFTDDYLLIHLRMTGDMRVEPEMEPDGAAIPLLPHDRMVVQFEEGLRLVFTDARKFGRVWLSSAPEEVTGKLGPEPLTQTLSEDAFYALLQMRKRQIKPLLLDQTFLAGMGNIYTDEALFLAHIHPLRMANRLTRAESNTLLAAIRQVLSEGIARNGASFDWVYKGGAFEFRVYKRTGKACPNCGMLINKMTVGQRGTHYCPACQPE